MDYPVLVLHSSVMVKKPREKVVRENIRLDCVIHPATSRMKNPIKTDISPKNLFSWLFLPLQKSVKLVQDNPCYISLYMLLHMYLHILKP